MAQRVIDALELVDIDVEHGQLAVRRDVRQLAPELFAEQRAVRQIGKRIVVGEVGDAFLGPAAFGDVRGSPPSRRTAAAR